MSTSPPPLYGFAKLVVPPLVRTWVRLDCQGLERVPEHGPLIFASNHTSHFDPMCLGVFIDATGHPVRFLAKSELFSVQVVGWALRNLDQIPVVRNTRQAHRSLDAAVEEMRTGAAVAIYPEGTTTRDPDFMPAPAKNGVARLAALTGAPVVPVAMWGAHLLFSRHVNGPYRRGIPVVVRAGEPLQLGLDRGATLKELNAARDLVMARIGELVIEVRRGWEEPAWYRSWRTQQARRRAA